MSSTALDKARTWTTLVLTGVGVATAAVAVELATSHQQAIAAGTGATAQQTSPFDDPFADPFGGQGGGFDRHQSGGFQPVNPLGAGGGGVQSRTGGS